MQVLASSVSKLENCLNACALLQLNDVGIAEIA